MTAVFQVNGNSSLQNFQLGMPDIVAAASIAYSAYGWLGGLIGVTSIFKLIKNPEQERKRRELLPKALITPLCARILTAQGIAFVPNRLDDLEYTFGGHPAGRMIGLSLCALSHELGLVNATEIFTQYMVPLLFREELDQMEGLTETLNVQLQDHGRSIVNEGAARGLPQ